jgi:hypothetical protein
MAGLVPAIYVEKATGEGRSVSFRRSQSTSSVRRPDVDDRHKAGHDDFWWLGRCCIPWRFRGDDEKNRAPT